MTEHARQPDNRSVDVADGATQPPSKANALLARGLLIVWAPVLLLMLSSLMTSHWIPLPTPSKHEEKLQTGLAALANEHDLTGSDKWTVYHVLYAGCRCSRQAFDYLTDRLPQQEVRDVVLLIAGSDEDLEAACDLHNVPCVPLSQQQLEDQLGIEAAPLFIAAAPDGTPHYVGGYTDRKQSLDYRDLEVVARLRAGETVAPLPVFGCGVSNSLQDALDPFGLKY